MYITFWHSAAINKDLKPYTVSGFEPGIFCSWGGRDDHKATTPWLEKVYFPSMQIGM
jgi:hypothetical protein